MSAGIMQWAGECYWPAALHSSLEPRCTTGCGNRVRSSIVVWDPIAYGVLAAEDALQTLTYQFFH